MAQNSERKRPASPPSDTDRSTPRQTAPKSGRSPSALPPDAIAVSKAISVAEATKISRSLFRKKNTVKAVVAALDIRRSTTFMLHVEDFDWYARKLANFIAFVRSAAATRGGWFDKFTGDGALLFWPDDELGTNLLTRVLDFATVVQTNFIKTTLPQFRVVAGCIPENFGLSIGLDYGRCLLSDMQPETTVTYDGKPLASSLHPSSITVLGRAVVGAVRMVGAAGPHETLLNEGPGEFFYRIWEEHKLDHPEIQIKRVMVENKDLASRQFAYRLYHQAIADALAVHYNPEAGASGGGPAA